MSIERRALRSREKWGKYLSALEEDIRHHLSIKSFSIGQQRARTAMKRLDTARLSDISLSIKSQSVSSMLTLLSLLIPVIVLWIGLTDVAEGRKTLGIFIAFNSYLVYVTGPVQRLVEAYRMFKTSSASYKRIQEVCALPPEEAGSACVVGPLKNCIEFKDVSYSYDGVNYALRSINQRIEKGKHIAVIGPNGSGKSSFLMCLPKFITLEDGTLLYDGVPYNDISAISLRRQMALVPEQAALFSGTLLSNIRLAKPSAGAEEIEDLLANLGFFLGANVDKDILYRHVAEASKGMSEGQRQMIGLARAFLKKPEILIIDEGLSNLDPENRRKVSGLIHDEFANSTVIWTMHNYEAAERFDLILFMEKGKIVDAGTHSELLRSCKWYVEKANRLA
jgi:ATP-binding cassette subfamily B protein